MQRIENSVNVAVKAPSRENAISLVHNPRQSKKSNTLFVEGQADLVTEPRNLECRELTHGVIGASSSSSHHGASTLMISPKGAEPLWMLAQSTG